MYNFSSCCNQPSVVLLPNVPVLGVRFLSVSLGLFAWPQYLLMTELSFVEIYKILISL